jgi:DNA-binding NarL/FixJ family response regulator
MTSQVIQIGIADDHKSMCQALKCALSRENSISVVLEAENGDDLIRKLSYCNPDILLLDIKMPQRNGIDALKIIYDSYPEIKVLILSAFIDEIYVAQCLQYGIYGYLTKSMDIGEIVKAIHLASRNEMFLTNLLSNGLAKKYLISNHKKTEKSLPDFSNDEIRILSLLTEEKTTEEISEIMNFSKRSIEQKRDKMKEKANVKTIGGLLLYALKRGIID